MLADGKLIGEDVSFARVKVSGKRALKIMVILGWFAFWFCVLWRRIVTVARGTRKGRDILETKVAEVISEGRPVLISVVLFSGQRNW